MDISPPRTKYNVAQHKPKISFVYQSNSPVPSKVNLTPRTQNKQNCYNACDDERQRSPFLRYPIPPSGLKKQMVAPSYNSTMPKFLKQKISNNITPFETQGRIPDKPLSPGAKKQNNVVIPHLQNNFTRSTLKLSSISKISQKSQQESRASHTLYEHLPEFPCSSSQRSQNQSFSIKQKHLQELRQKCSKCQAKDAAYQLIKNKVKLCAQCGISELINGSQLCQLKNKNQNKMSQILSEENSQISAHENSYNNGRSSHIVKQPTRQIQTQQLLNQVNSDKKSLLKLYRSFESNQKTHIANFYKQKRYSLKEHYQKIKTAIKHSIESDLKELDRLEEQEKDECENQKKRMQDDIEMLENIEKDLTGNWPKLMNQYEINQERYVQIINNHRLNSSRITNHQWENSQKDSFLSSEKNFQNLCFNENKANHLDLYNSKTYRMYLSKGEYNFGQNKSDVLFSFQNPKIGN